MEITFKFQMLFLILILIGSISTDPVMIRPLSGPGITPDPSPRGYWDGDLGIPFLTKENKLLMMLGDVNAPQRTPNAIALVSPDLSNIQWIVDSQGEPIPFFPLLAQSTVPGGAISLNDSQYVFMMNVIQWNNGLPGNVHASSLLGKSTSNFQFVPVNGVGFPVDSKFINIAPILSQGKNRQLYLVASGYYRNSPIYLSKVLNNQIESMNQYRYYSGNNTWTSNLDNAQPIVVDENVGELSVRWNNYLNKYLLMYFGWTPTGAGWLKLRSADELWGPWSEPEVIFAYDSNPDWYQPGWFGSYGGYLLPVEFSEGSIVYFTLSVWVPYRSFLMQIDLKQLKKLH